MMKKYLLFFVLFSGFNFFKSQIYGDFPYNQPFTSGTQPSEISLLTPQSGLNSTTFTTNGMQLTPAANARFGAVYVNNRQFSSANGIKVEFEYGMYGGNGADGFSFFLFDAAVGIPTVGAKGAGMGYGYIRANNNFAGNRESGLSGAYLGIGFDAFGNFKNRFYQGDARSNGILSTTFNQGASHVTLRGKRGTLNQANGLGLGFTGYPVLTTQSTLTGTAGAATINPANGTYTTAAGLGGGFSLNTTNFTTDPNNAEYRKAFIEMVPNALGGFNVTVKIQHGNTVTTVINNYWYQNSYVYSENANPAASDFNGGNGQGAATTHTLNTAAPANFRVGFGASTGGLNNIHLIRGLKITLPFSAVSGNDVLSTCQNGTATVSPLDNDLAYVGPISGTPAASSLNIDPASFQFIDVLGTAQGTSYTAAGMGTWVYNALTKIVTFTPVTGYTGTTTIKYNIKGLTIPYNDDGYRSEPAAITATVNAFPTISGANSVCVSKTTQLTGSAPTAGSTWSSNAMGIATVSATGLVTGVSAGTATITYTNGNGCPNTVMVTVNDLPTITGNASVCLGKTSQLTGSSPTAGSTWSSNANGVASVSSTGLVSGGSAGTATITYTNGNGCQTTLLVTVDSNCLCYKPAATGGTVLNTNHGVTALSRAGTDNSNWPMVRKGAWTVLEAKTKGFVINRMATTAAVNAIASPVEGMMVYDEEADCLKINTTGTAAGWKCFTTQTCPD